MAAERRAALLCPQADDESFPGAVCSSMSVRRDIIGAGEEGRDGDDEATVCGRTVSAIYVRVLFTNVV